MKEYVIEICDNNYVYSLLSQKAEVLKFKSREAARQFADSELKTVQQIRYWTILSVHYAIMDGYDINTGFKKHSK